MVLGKLTVPGRPTISIAAGQGTTALAVGAGGGLVWTFLPSSIFSLLSPSLWETARYRLKYCLKTQNNQPTNQPQYKCWLVLQGRVNSRNSMICPPVRKIMCEFFLPAIFTNMGKLCEFPN